MEKSSERMFIVNKIRLHNACVHGFSWAMAIRGEMFG